MTSTTTTAPDIPQMRGVLRFDPLPDETNIILQSVPRSPGLHLSSILKALDRDLHGAYHKAGGFNLNLCADIGFTWERVIEIAYKSMVGLRPGEIEKDGVLMSPDGIGEDPLGIVPFTVHEYKCWFRSTRRTPMHDWYVIMQNMCYCHAMGTTVGVFRVLYLVGDSWQDGPKYKQWRIEYDPAEMELAWQMVIRNKALGTVEEGKK